MSRSKGLKYENLSILWRGIHVIESEVWRKSMEIFLSWATSFKAELHAFFISNTFISRLKLATNHAKAKQYPQPELLLFEN